MSFCHALAKGSGELFMHADRQAIPLRMQLFAYRPHWHVCFSMQSPENLFGLHSSWTLADVFGFSA